MPLSHNRVFWHEWSPSGRWIVLSSHYSTGEGGNFAQQIQIVSTDGQQRIDLGTQRLSSFGMQWAPQEDILLIVTVDWRDGGVRHQLFDVNEGRYLADTRLQNFGFDVPDQMDLEWTADGQLAYVSWSRHVVTLHQDGYTEIRVDDMGRRWRIESNFHAGICN